MIEELDTRLKIVFFTIFSIAVATSRNWVTIVLGLAFLLFIALISRLSLKSILSKLLVVEEILLLIVILLPFTHPGGLKEGIREGILIFSRSSVIVMGSIIFLGSSNLFSLIRGLEDLKMPRKLILIASFALRYIDTVKRESERLKKAMKARAFKPKTNLHTYKSYAYLLSMIVLRSYERAERVYQAMLCRGFNGSFPVYRAPSPRARDSLSLSPFIVVYLSILVFTAWR